MNSSRYHRPDQSALPFCQKGLSSTLAMRCITSSMHVIMPVSAFSHCVFRQVLDLLRTTCAATERASIEGSERCCDEETESSSPKLTYMISTHVLCDLTLFKLLDVLNKEILFVSEGQPNLPARTGPICATKFACGKRALPKIHKTAGRSVICGEKSADN